MADNVFGLFHSGVQMKILVLHNRYKQHGGEDVTVENEKMLLTKHAHEVVLCEANNKQITGAWSRVKTAGSAVYSQSSKRLVTEAVLAFKPAVVHAHNLFPLISPSAYDACVDASIPVVQTLQNYRQVCPNALLLRGGRICETCLKKIVPWPGVIHGCYRSSHVQSTAVATMIAFHRLRGTWQKRVNVYIVLTEFQKAKMIHAGLPAEKIMIKPNFIFDPGGGAQGGNFALFVGRLAPEKGLGTVLRAYKLANLDVSLKICGRGTQEVESRAAIGQSNLGRWITLVGEKAKQEVLGLMKAARFLVFPSVWYEGFPLTIVEAFACGLPVIASRIGGIPEIVEDGRTGWLVEPGNPDAWARAIKEAWDDPEECARRGREARAEYLAKYTPEKNYEQLMAIYESVINKRKN